MQDASPAHHDTVLTGMMVVVSMQSSVPMKHRPAGLPISVPFRFTGSCAASLIWTLCLPLFPKQGRVASARSKAAVGLLDPSAVLVLALPLIYLYFGRCIFCWHIFSSFSFDLHIPQIEPVLRCSLRAAMASTYSVPAALAFVAIAEVVVVRLIP